MMFPEKLKYSQDPVPHKASGVMGESWGQEEGKMGGGWNSKQKDLLALVVATGRPSESDAESTQLSPCKAVIATVKRDFCHNSCPPLRLHWP